MANPTFKNQEISITYRGNVGFVRSDSVEEAARTNLTITRASWIGFAFGLQVDSKTALENCLTRMSLRNLVGPPRFELGPLAPQSALSKIAQEAYFQVLAFIGGHFESC
jgi:hypothetical protein